MHYKNIFIIMLSAILCSCATLGKNIPREYSLEQNSGKGIVTFSLSSNLVAGNPMNDFYLFARKVGEGDGLSSAILIPYWAIGWEREFGNGRLVAIEMEPGEYEFFKTMLFMSGPQSETTFKSGSFMVKKGKITYLGGLIAIVGEGLEMEKPYFSNSEFMFSGEIESIQGKPKANGKVSVKKFFINFTKADRDIDLLLQKHPYMKMSDVIYYRLKNQ